MADTAPLRMTRSSLLLGLLSVLWLCNLQAEVRRWTSRAGTSLEAAMTGVDVAARTISLKKADGSVITIPIDALTDADRSYAAAQWKAMQSGAAPAPGAAPAAMPAAKPATAPATTPVAPKPTVASNAPPAPPRPAITVLPVKGFKAPNAADYIAKVLKTRPRLIYATPGWEALKTRVTADPLGTKMLANLKAGGEKLLETPELTRVFGEQRGTVTPGSKALFRMATLATLHFLDGDPRWKERGIRELVAITDPATFQNWYVDEPEVTADFLIAACLAYDAFRDGLTAKQVTEVKSYMIEKGVDALAARLKGDPIPETARGQSAGAEATAKAKAKAPPPKPAARKDADEEVDAEHMVVSSALIMAALCLSDEDPGAARKAIETAGKMFGQGMTQFAPAGIWPEGLEAGERVLDYAILVLQSLRANAGTDFGFSVIEGLPQVGLTRLHLVGPTGSMFNYGDAAGVAFSRPWVGTWLAGVHGNMGSRALTAGAAPSPEASNLTAVGNLLFFNPHAAGEGKADSMDYGVVGGQVAALRSGWEPEAMYLAIKGGDNRVPSSQLDLGTFVLDAGGTRWAIELGSETDRAPGFDPKAADRSKRYQLYVEGTPGQNTLEIGQAEEQPAAKKGAPPPKPVISTNQSLDARAALSLVKSAPEAGMAVVDLEQAYSKVAKSALRGAMVVRGAKPYVVLQDELNIKNNTPVVWKMHTRAEVAPEGSTVKLTDKGKTMHLAIVSPPGASFSVDDAPEPANEQMKKLTGIKVLKINLGEVKGARTICVTAALDDKPPAHALKPLEEWAGKK